MLEKVLDEMAGSTGQLSQIGIMNKISTGNMAVDVLICLLLPLILGKAKNWAQNTREWLEKWLRHKNEFFRDINYTFGEGWFCYDEETADNNILHEAIHMYLEKIRPQLKAYRWADVRLLYEMVVQDDSDDDTVTMSSDSGSGSGSGSDSDTDSEDYSYAERLRHYKVHVLPPENEWIEVESGLWLKRHDSTEDIGRGEGSRTKRTNIITLKSDQKNGEAIIDAFIDNAFTYYKQRMDDRKNTDRHLYTPLFRCFVNSKEKGDSDNASEAQSMLFKRYKLSEEKTFASFFHPEKDALLNLVDRFIKKTGKFAIPGYPHKLGILLHGPPGTGKTSLIKALAQYTDRSIVSIPLSRVKTNQELMSLVFDQCYKVSGESKNVRLPFKKTVFVMEDVDAACDVVLRRKSKVLETHPKESAADEIPSILLDTAVPKPSAPGGSVNAWTTNPWFKEDDKLNLAGLLNVLDGVVDCPSRILVMTTNHPEKLDPALIRPGRINKTLYMGKMRLQEAVQMAAHYYGPVSDEDIDALRSYMPDYSMAPAQLEALCAEADTVGQLVGAINKVLAEKPKDMVTANRLE